MFIMPNQSRYLLEDPHRIYVTSIIGCMVTNIWSTFILIFVKQMSCMKTLCTPVAKEDTHTVLSS